MKAKNYSLIRSGKGTEFPAGTDFELTYQRGSSAVRCVSSIGPILVKCENMHKYFKSFKKAPSMRALENQMDDGRCTTITGKGGKVEADGIGADGMPSWPLALGII